MHFKCEATKKTTKTHNRIIFYVFFWACFLVHVHGPVNVLVRVNKLNSIKFTKMKMPPKRLFSSLYLTGFPCGVGVARAFFISFPITGSYASHLNILLKPLIARPDDRIHLIHLIFVSCCCCFCWHIYFHLQKNIVFYVCCFLCFNDCFILLHS